MAGEGGHGRRKPEETVLYEAMRLGWAGLEVQLPLPYRVQQEVRRYFHCGQLRYGFVEVQCAACRQVTLVAFSCKGRGWCPSCTTRRAIEAGAHAEARLPMASHRQWTLSLPRALRLVVVKEPSLFKVVERTLVQAVWRWQRAEARRLGVGGPRRVESGAVAMAQYFGSRLQLTPHLHVLVPEVVWDEAGQPVELPPPDEGAVEAVLVRAVRQLARRWPSEEVPWEEDEYRQLQQAAVQERLALEVPPRRRRGLVAVVEGFSLHAGTWVHGNDRQGLERLVRYGARGPVAESRLSRLADGRYRYAPKGDGPGVDLTAEALVKRLVALLPPARKHLTTFHGVYAPNARLRRLVMRSVPDARALPLKPQAELELAAQLDPPPPAQRRPRLDWATLQARTFGNDVWSCPCGGRRHVLALVTSHSTAEEVLSRLGLLEPRRAFRHHGPAPPQLALPL